MASSILPSTILNRVLMDRRAWLGSFLLLTVLMRSGTSDDLSLFMVWMNFFCWISRRMAMFLASSSRVLVNWVLLLVKVSQST